MRTMTIPDSSGAHTKAARLYTCFSEGNRVCGAEFARQRCRKPACTKPCRTHAISCANDEFSAFHDSSSRHWTRSRTRGLSPQHDLSTLLDLIQRRQNFLAMLVRIDAPI